MQTSVCFLGFWHACFRGRCGDILASVRSWNSQQATYKVGEVRVKAEREAVNAAYEFVQPSYTLLVSRLDAADGRMQSVQNFAATLTFAVPVLAKAIFGDELGFGSLWFITAMVLFGTILAIGIVARVRGGHLKLVDPGKLYNKWLGFKTQDSFRAYMLGYAARDFVANKALVNRRGNLAVVSTALFGVEVVLLLLWVFGVGGV